jgi:glycosyltransferase involved in cell wall biosynthesis
MAETNRKPAVTVVLPAFNEAEVVGETVKRIRELHPDFEVLVVDDGSTDSTMQAAMDAGANVWPHPYNMGNGAAVKSGLRAARGDYVVLMDADGQHDPADIARLLEYADRFDMVVGARTKASKTKAHRNLANSIYNRFASYVTKFKIEDLTSGFRVMRRATVEQYIYLLPNTFSYPSTITMAYLRSGRSVTYVPIETAKRLGKSKIKLVRDGIRFLLIITKIATLFCAAADFYAGELRLFPIGFRLLLVHLYDPGTFHQHVGAAAEQRRDRFSHRIGFRAGNAVKI